MDTVKVPMVSIKGFYVKLIYTDLLLKWQYEILIIIYHKIVLQKIHLKLILQSFI